MLGENGVYVYKERKKNKYKQALKFLSSLLLVIVLIYWHTSHFENIPWVE